VPSGLRHLQERQHRRHRRARFGRFARRPPRAARQLEEDLEQGRREGPGPRRAHRRPGDPPGGDTTTPAPASPHRSRSTTRPSRSPICRRSPTPATSRSRARARSGKVVKADLVRRSRTTTRASASAAERTWPASIPRFRSSPGKNWIERIHGAHIPEEIECVARALYWGPGVAAGDKQRAYAMAVRHRRGLGRGQAHEEPEDDRQVRRGRLEVGSTARPSARELGGRRD
jgi:hypothetical protein